MARSLVRPLMLRLPPLLHRCLRRAAKRNGRSLNTEIVNRLMSDESEIFHTMGRVRRAMPRNGDVVELCDRLEKFLISGGSPEKTQNGPVRAVSGTGSAAASKTPDSAGVASSPPDTIIEPRKKKP